MTKKTVGYVDLEWICPTCGNRNPGPVKKCSSCGMAQPENVEFVQPAQAQMITDEAKIAAAKAGPDVHCPYCGTRNAAGARVCKQCGGDLTSAKAREAGQVVGALQTAPAPPVKCPACGTENPATALRCSNCGSPLPGAQPKPAAPVKPAAAPRFPVGILIAVAVIAVIACLVIFLVAGGGGGKTEQVTGMVSDVSWKRTIAVQALVPVTRQDWRDNIPGNARVGRCGQRLYETVDEPAPGSKEVCGTPYVVDTGTGVGEVQQDCQYEVYADYCDYSALDWQLVAPIVVTGRDLNPRWPAASFKQDQREAGREEDYIVTFETENGPVELNLSNFQRFQQFDPGSKWNLEVNGRGQVVNAEPAE